MEKKRKKLTKRQRCREEYCRLFNEGPQKWPHKKLAYHFKISIHQSGTWARRFKKEGENLPNRLQKNKLPIPTLEDVKLQEQEIDKKTDISNDAKVILDLLNKKSHSVGELSRCLNPPKGVSKEYIIKLIDELRKGYFKVQLIEEKHEVVLDKEPRISTEPIPLEPLYRYSYKFGVISDMHLCSKCQQLTLLHTCYKIGEEEKIQDMFNCGDITEGSGKHYRGQMQEMFIYGADNQRKYIVEHYPETKKFKTLLISGFHDMDYLRDMGYNIIEHICKERKDLIYKGDCQAMFEIKKIKIEMLHPTGGVPYARSYRQQKILEGIIGGVIQKIAHTKDLSLLPKLHFTGHLHIINYLPYMGIHSFLVPCLQSQTIYLRQRGLAPVIGMWIVQVDFDKNYNINRIIPDFRDMTHLAKENDY